MAGRQKKAGKDTGWGAWVAIVVLFALGIWPIALIWLLVKLFGKDRQTPQPAPSLSEQAKGAQAAPQSSSPTRAKTVVRTAMKSPLPKKSNAKWLKIIGIVLLVGGVAGMGGPIDALFWSDYWLSLWLPELLQAVCDYYQRHGNHRPKYTVPTKPAMAISFSLADRRLYS